MTACSPAIGRVGSLEDALCFQHFGVDIIVKQDLTPLICEINRGPVMDAKCPRYAAIKDTVLRSGLSVAGLTGETDHGFVQLREIQP